MQEIKVVLADDHDVVRNGVKAALNGAGDINIVGEAVDGEDTIQKIEELSPDVLIVDISMPKLTGIEVTQIVTEKHPKTNVLILSMHEDEQYILKSIEAGALGYLPKDSKVDEILDAVRFIAKGEMYYSNTVSQILAQSILNKNKRDIGDSNQKPLSSREIEILRFIVEGLSNKLVASKLYISIRTVDAHRHNIMKKLKVNNAAELVRKAIEEKLV